MENQIDHLRDASNLTLEHWREQEKLALDLLQIIGELRFDQSIELVFFRNDLYDQRPSELVDIHKLAVNYTNKSIPLSRTLTLAHAILNYDGLRPAKIDVGKMALDWTANSSSFKSIEGFVHNALDNLYADSLPIKNSADVVLYGFGRIGRLAARRIIGQTGKGEQLRLRAIVVRPKMSDKYAETQKRADLLKKDSVHGNFGGEVEVSPDGTQLIINGNRIQMIYAKSPKDIDYTEYGIKDALLIDNTGVWRNRAELSEHLRPGIAKVCLTAPADDIPNIVYGANQQTLDLEKDNIFCAASCTTNAISPLLKVIDSHWGVEKGHLETIHAYTSDQNLLDNFHKKPRRGRGAALNMVVTSTGAAKAVSKVFPKLQGKLTGNAVRVPTPNVSLAILVLSLEKATDLQHLKQVLKEAALHGDFVEQVDYSESSDYVSSQAIGMTSTSVVDAPSLSISKDGKLATIYAWYDNEYGYTCQVIRLAKHASGVRRPCYF